MKILVTGAGGQVGSDLVALAPGLGLEVDGLNAKSLDITDHAQIQHWLSFSKPDVVINAAAYTAVDKAEDEPEVADLVNRMGPQLLAQACSGLSIPMVHLSTDYVFDGASDRAYLETDQENPKGVYGSTKLAGDRAVLAVDRSLVLRVSWVFGENGNNFVKTMLRLGSERREVRVVDDQVGGPTWSADIARAILKIVVRYRDKGQIPWGLYHFAGAPSVSWYAFAQEIFTQAGRLGCLADVPRVIPISSAEYPTKAIRPKNSRLDCDKIGTVFEISQPDWKRGLEQVIKHWGIHGSSNQ
jgi:dTDP-4-dehydrorhamnose reductase